MELTFPDANEVSPGKTKLKGLVQDANSCRVRVNKNQVAAPSEGGEWEAEIEIADDAESIEIEAWDSAGNQAIVRLIVKTPCRSFPASRSTALSRAHPGSIARSAHLTPRSS